MTAQEVYCNLSGFNSWDIQNYPLSKNEAEIILWALKMQIEAEKGGENENKSGTYGGVAVRADNNACSSGNLP